MSFAPSLGGPSGCLGSHHLFSLEMLTHRLHEDPAPVSPITAPLKPVGLHPKGVRPADSEQWASSEAGAVVLSLHGGAAVGAWRATLFCRGREPHVETHLPQLPLIFQSHVYLCKRQTGPVSRGEQELSANTHPAAAWPSRCLLGPANEGGETGQIPKHLTTSRAADGSGTSPTHCPVLPAGSPQWPRVEVRIPGGVADSPLPGVWTVTLCWWVHLNQLTDGV